MKLTESIVQKNSLTNRISFLSGASGILALHHTMNGAFRKKSTRYGLWVWLTPTEHDRVHSNQKQLKALKAYSQRKFEALYGHEKWMKEFGKDYLEASNEVDWRLYKALCEREGKPRANV